MRRFLVLTFFFLSLTQAEAFTTQVLAVSSAIASENYPLADSLIGELPQPWQRTFWRGAWHAARWNDLRQADDYLAWKKIFSAMEQSDSDSLTAEQKFYSAQAIGQLGIDVAQAGDLVGAVGKSWQSVALLEAVLRAHPEWIDAKTGIAVFRYWVADRLPAYYWLSLRFSTKEKSIETLEQVAREGRLHRELALQQLFWIYLNEERFDEAETCLDRYRQMHEQTRLLFWLAYFLSAHTGDFAAASDYLLLLEQIHLDQEFTCTINLTEIRVNQLDMLIRLERFAEADAVRTRLQGISPSAFERDYLRSKYQRLEELSKKLDRLWQPTSKK
jgi:tetratricopeptide (TPR) repeat protein